MKRIRRTLLIILALVLVITVGGLAFVKITRGSGKAYPDISTAPRFGDDALEIVAELPYPPGNVAVSEDGRIFFNYHWIGGPEGNTVFALIDGTPSPYPNEEFQENFKTTLGMLIDTQNRLWTIDPASLENRNTRLLAFDLETDEVVYDYTFETNDADFAQDLQVTSDGRYVFVASTGLFRFVSANIMVLDTQTNEAWTVLAGHESVEPQNWRIHTQAGEGVQIGFGLIDWQAGVDGLALTKDDEWLYYAAINHDTLYRIRVADLLDRELSDDELANRIEAVGQKPLSDGLSMDIEGNVYITDIENGGIARMTSDGDLETLVKDERVRWADGISFGADAMIYFSDSAIPAILTNTLEPLSSEAMAEQAPFYLFRFQSDIEGVPGS